MIIRVLDWILILAVVGVGIPAIIISEQRFYAAIGVLIGLGLVNTVGNWAVNKIALLKITLEKMDRVENHPAG